MVLVKPDGRKVGLKAIGGYPQQWSWTGGGAVPLVGQALFSSYTTLYRTQPWLAAAVNKLKNMIARLPLKSYQLDADGGRTRLRDHPIPNVLHRPNPGMSSFRLKEWMIADLALYGNSLTRVFRAPNGEPLELYPLPWPNIEIMGKDQPSMYIFHSPLGPIPFPADQAIHLRFWSANACYERLVGNSPVEPLRRTLMNEDAAGRWTSALFQNAARPSGFATTDQKLNRDQISLIREELQQLYGGVDNAFKIAIGHSGLKWEAAAMTAVDAALADLRRLDREEVAAAYDIPPPMLQILDKATFSNVTEQHRNLYQDTLSPWLTLVEEEFYAQLIAPVKAYSDVFVEFDLNEVLKGAPAERAAFYAVARRWLTINEIRQKENEQPLQGDMYDTVFMPINEFPIGQGPPAPGTPPPGKTLIEALDRAETYAASRIGAGKNGFDSGRFARELLKDLGRTDEAGKPWANAVAQTVEETIHGAGSPSELHRRMAELEGWLLTSVDDTEALRALESERMALEAANA
jgi:HK97 family phage portal protein